MLKSILNCIFAHCKYVVIKPKYIIVVFVPWTAPAIREQGHCSTFEAYIYFLLHICLYSITSLVLQLPVGESPVPHELEAGVTIQFSQVMVQMWWSTFAGQGHTVTQEEFLEFGKRLLISF
jgi:hypothetical protein